MHIFVYITDHLTPTVLWQNCVTCSNNHLGDDWIESFDPNLPYFEQREDLEEPKRLKGNKKRKKKENKNPSDHSPLPGEHQYELEKYSQEFQNERGRGRGRGRGKGRERRSSSQRGDHNTPRDDSRSLDRGSGVDARRVHSSTNPEAQNFLDSLFQPQQDVRGKSGDNQRRGGFRGRRPPRRGGTHRNFDDEGLQNININQQNTRYGQRGRGDVHFREGQEADVGFRRGGQIGFEQGVDGAFGRGRPRGRGRGGERGGGENVRGGLGLGRRRIGGRRLNWI